MTENAAQFRQFFERSRDGIVMVDANGHIIDANSAYCDMLGYTLEELKRKKDFYELTPGEWREWERNEIWDKRLLKEGYSGIYRKEYIRKDGSVFPVELQSYAVKDDEGKIEYLWGVARDITRTVRIGKELREKERFLDIVESVARIGGWEMDMVSGGKAFWTRGVYDIVGLEPGDPIPGYDEHIDWYLPEYRDMVRQKMRELVDTGKPVEFEAMLRTGRGELKWCRAMGEAEREHGKTVKIRGTFQDMTEHKEARAAREESETRFRELFNRMKSGVAVYEAVGDGKDFVFRDINPAGAAMCETAREALLGRKLTEAFPAVEDFGLLEKLREVRKTGRSSDREAVLYKDDRLEKWFENHVFLLPNGEIVVMFDDRTAIKQAEKQILDLARFPQENPEPVIRVSNDKKVKFANGPAREVLELLGSGRHKAAPPEWNNILEGCFSEKRDREEVIRAGDRVFSFLFVCVSDDYVNIYGRDITEKTEVSEELGKYKKYLEKLVRLRTRELEEVNQELESFSYSVSHDLRAPLRAIDGFSRILREECSHLLKGQCEIYLVRIIENGRKMERLIDDLLQLSRVTRREMRLSKVDLTRIAERSLRELEERDPGRDVKARIQGGLYAKADENLMRVALDNLLSNSWKFTRGVASPVIEFGLDEKDGKKTFFVRDNGAGFDMRYAGKLFGAFQRMHTENEFPGTGVGLATVKRVINRHGGRIWAEASPGKGATFYFTLPG